MVTSPLTVGGVSSATNVAPSTSGARHFEQLAAPSGLLVLQWGQFISETNFLLPENCTQPTVFTLENQAFKGEMVPDRILRIVQRALPKVESLVKLLAAVRIRQG
jgi:hypothetical protein